jgi:hypothetical protein
MPCRSIARRQKNPHESAFRPQVVGLEERLPLGDALLGPLLTAGWLGASLTPISEGETPDVPTDNRTLARGWQGDSTDSLWAGLVGEAGAQEQLAMAPAARPVRPLPSGVQEMGDLGTTPGAGARVGPAQLPEVSAFVGQTEGLTAGLAPRGANAPSERISVLPAGNGRGGTAVPVVAHRTPTASKEQVQQNYARLPLSFEANVGQADAAVHFLAHGPGYGLYFSGTEAVMVLSQGSGIRDQGSGIGKATALPTRSVSEEPTSLTPEASTAPSVVRMQLVGGNPTMAMVGEDPLPGKVNYFLGNDRSQWHTHIATFAKVEYQQVYPGIDLDYYGNGQDLEYDFVVAPGADPGVIRLGFAGADGVAVNAQGDLVIHAGGPDILQHKPLVYQEVNGARQEIASSFVVTSDHSPLTTHQVGFALGAYDASRPLVIDPVLSYSTYLGGSGDDYGVAIAVDPATGDALVTGYSSSTNFPTANAFQPTNHGGYDAFVTRLSADGSALVYSTYLGGSDVDFGRGIAVDPATGDALVTGYTSSTNFPTANALQPNYGGGEYDAFVARLSADGSALVYSTYLGGGGDDFGWSIAADPATGDALVAGSTYSTNFPTANAFQPTNHGVLNAFVTRLSADGSALVYSTYLGGSDADFARGIAVDPATGDALVTGYTISTDFPTANALQPTNHGGEDAFVTRLSADGSALVYSTYLGGSFSDHGWGIAVDPATGDALITGETDSTDFPTANALQPTNHGFYNAFVTRLSADGSTLVYSTYLGGSASFGDGGNGIAVDPATGDALVTGYTSSADFPTANPLQPNYGGGTYDAFVTRLSADGSALLYSTYLGGSGSDGGNGIAVDPATGDALVTGYTQSTDFPTANPLQANNAGGSDAFVARIS